MQHLTRFLILMLLAGCMASTRTVYPPTISNTKGPTPTILAETTPTKSARPVAAPVSNVPFCIDRAGMSADAVDNLWNEDTDGRCWLPVPKWTDTSGLDVAWSCRVVTGGAVLCEYNYIDKVTSATPAAEDWLCQTKEELVPGTLPDEIDGRCWVPARSVVTKDVVWICYQNAGEASLTCYYKYEPYKEADTAPMIPTKISKWMDALVHFEPDAGGVGRPRRF